MWVSGGCTKGSHSHLPEIGVYRSPSPFRNSRSSLLSCAGLYVEWCCTDGGGGGTTKSDISTDVQLDQRLDRTTSYWCCWMPASYTRPSQGLKHTLLRFTVENLIKVWHLRLIGSKRVSRNTYKRYQNDKKSITALLRYASSINSMTKKLRVYWRAFVLHSRLFHVVDPWKVASLDIEPSPKEGSGWREFPSGL